MKKQFLSLIAAGLMLGASSIKAAPTPPIMIFGMLIHYVNLIYPPQDQANAELQDSWNVALNAPMDYYNAAWDWYSTYPVVSLKADSKGRILKGDVRKQHATDVPAIHISIEGLGGQNNDMLRPVTYRERPTATATLIEPQNGETKRNYLQRVKTQIIDLLNTQKDSLLQEGGENLGESIDDPS